jgi:phospholipid/cholesterol/gamma-HCH transport system permease protein
MPVVIFCALMNLFANKRVDYVLTELGQIALLTREVFASALTFKVAWRDLLYQIYFIGIKSQSVVLVTGAFTGMVLGAHVFPVSQGENGHGHACGRERFDVQ